HVQPEFAFEQWPQRSSLAEYKPRRYDAPSYPARREVEFMFQLSPVVYGTMGFDNSSNSERVRVIQCAVDYGMTSLDTAPLYGCGEAETIVGQAIKGRRDQVQVLTKCGLRWDSNVGKAMFPVVVDGVSRTLFRNNRPESVTQEVEASL